MFLNVSTLPAILKLCSSVTAPIWQGWVLMLPYKADGYEDKELEE